MAKITDMTQDLEVSGAEKIYVVDGSQDKYATLNALKSLFGSQIGTLATLKTYKGLADNQVIFLIGGTTPNDSKAGIFYWDADSTVAADDDLIVQVTGEVTGRWIRAVEDNYLRSDTSDTLNGSLTVTQNLTVSGNGQVGGTLGVTGQFTAQGDAQVNGDINCSGDVESVTGTITTMRTGTLRDLSNNNPVTVQTIAEGTAKAWVNFNGTGTVAIRDSFNVSSITDNGTGLYTINFSNAMPSANYCQIAWARGHTSTNDICASAGSDGTKTTSACQVRTTTFSAWTDSPEVGVVIFVY